MMMISTDGPNKLSKQRISLRFNLAVSLARYYHRRCENFIMTSLSITKMAWEKHTVDVLI